MRRLKNYTTVVPAARSIENVESMLVEHRADSIMKQYDDGRLSSLKFRMIIEGTPAVFTVPVRWRETMLALAAQGLFPKRRGNVLTPDDEDKAYRIAWKNMSDWVAAQMTVVDLGIFDAAEVFTPYITDGSGRTLYEHIKDEPGRFLALGDGKH
jgi:hypothetical protein